MCRLDFGYSSVCILFFFCGSVSIERSQRNSPVESFLWWPCYFQSMQHFILICLDSRLKSLVLLVQRHHVIVMPESGNQARTTIDCHHRDIMSTTTTATTIATLSLQHQHNDMKISRMATVHSRNFILLKDTSTASQWQRFFSLFEPQ